MQPYLRGLESTISVVAAAQEKASGKDRFKYQSEGSLSEVKQCLPTSVSLATFSRRGRTPTRLVPKAKRR